jgi:hypothetical protein
MSPPFDPEAFMAKWETDSSSLIPSHENGFSFRDCIIRAFDLPEDDEYVYRAQGATTLRMTQKAIDAGRANGLHGWYVADGEGDANAAVRTSHTFVSLFAFYKHCNCRIIFSVSKCNDSWCTVYRQVTGHLSGYRIRLLWMTGCAQ